MQMQMHQWIPNSSWDLSEKLSVPNCVSVYRRNAIRQSEIDHVQRASGTDKSGSNSRYRGKVWRVLSLGLRFALSF